MSRVGPFLPWLFGFAIVAGGTDLGWGQSNLDAGKTAAQLFADTCAACHRSPRELKPTNAGFLRQHYSTGGREAALMAAYLASIGSDPRAVQQRRPPALGAGQAPPTEAAAKPPEAGTPRPRRPADSMEIGNLPLGGPGGETEGAPSQTAAAPDPRPGPVEGFEE